MAEDDYTTDSPDSAIAKALQEGEPGPAVWPDQTKIRPQRKIKTDPKYSGKQYGDYGGKEYKFSEVQAEPAETVDWQATGSVGDVNVPEAYRAYDQGRGSFPEEPLVGGKPGDPKQLSDKEYQALTKAASEGNKLAQEILVKGKYKAKPYPTVQQDMTQLLNPIVNKLSGLGNVYQAGLAQQQQVMEPYNFTNAESQVQKIIQSTNVPQVTSQIMANQGPVTTNPAQEQQSLFNTTMQVAGAPATANYNTAMQNAMNVGKNAAAEIGAPQDIGAALAELGPAAKASEKATPYEVLLGALLSHIQYATTYGQPGGAGAGKSDPAWLQQLIASVTGSTASGGLPNPLIAASMAGGGNQMPGNQQSITAGGNG